MHFLLNQVKARVFLLTKKKYNYFTIINNAIILLYFINF